MRAGPQLWGEAEEGAEGRRHACRPRPLRNAIAPPRRQCGQLTEGRRWPHVLGSCGTYSPSHPCPGTSLFWAPITPYLQRDLGSGIAKTFWPLHLRLRELLANHRVSDFNQRCRLFRGITGAQENNCGSVFVNRVLGWGQGT